MLSGSTVIMDQEFSQWWFSGTRCHAVQQKFPIFWVEDYWKWKQDGSSSWLGIFFNPAGVSNMTVTQKLMQHILYSSKIYCIKNSNMSHRYLNLWLPKPILQQSPSTFMAVCPQDVRALWPRGTTNQVCCHQLFNSEMTSSTNTEFVTWRVSGSGSGSGGGGGLGGSHFGRKELVAALTWRMISWIHTDSHILGERMPEI
jgi:hypothetical protein